MKASIEDRIERSVLEAISEHRLPPGTKLGEQALSDMFSCNRANVRRALASLAAQHVVELIPNRGAFVVSPSPKDARDIFQARRAIERMTLEAACDLVTEDDLAELTSIIDAEEKARHCHDQPLALRLSTRFHLRLAEVAGNAVLTGFLADLTMRSALIIGLYADESPSHCEDGEHSRILTALSKRDRTQLLAEMDRHLSHLEADLNFAQQRNVQRPLKDLLQV